MQTKGASTQVVYRRRSPTDPLRDDPTSVPTRRVSILWCASRVHLRHPERQDRPDSTFAASRNFNLEGTNPKCARKERMKWLRFTIRWFAKGGSGYPEATAPKRVPASTTALQPG